MAHHHHHWTQPRQCCRNNQPSGCCSGACCCCACGGFTASKEGDSLVEAIVAQLVQSARPQPYFNYSKSHILQGHYQPKKPSFKQENQNQQQQSRALLSSLLRRIDALESSLLHFSAPPPSYSLRDAAARTIQRHFRAFLVRRSRTLSHLKELAIIKSAFNSLRSSVSQQTHFNSEVLSHKAMDLLLKLDSIQDSDSMIRDGKRSITQDLVRFLDFIDGVSVRRHPLRNKPERSMRTVKNPNKSTVFPNRVSSNRRNFDGDQRELVEKLRDRVEKIQGFSRVLENGEEDVELEGFQHIRDDEDENPSFAIIGSRRLPQARNGILVKRQELQPRVKKNVSFAENGNLSRFLGSTYEPVSCEGGPSMDQTELVENLNREVEENGGFPRGTEDDEEWDTESGGSPQTTDGERNPGRNLGTVDEHEIKHLQSQHGNFVFSAPLPLKMESRADFMKKRKALKIVT